MELSLGGNKVNSTLVIAVIGLAFTGYIGYHKIHVRQQGQVHLIQAHVAQEQADQQAKQELAALLEQVGRYRKRLPSEPDPSWLVREAVSLGRKAGLDLTTIAQESPQQFQQFTRLAINLQFSGSYHQLGTFLDYLEQSDHFIRVDSIELSAPKGTGGGTNIRLVLSTLFLPPLGGGLDG